MLHGRSNNVSKDGQASTFTWAARMHFRRSEDGKVLIDKYTIIPVSCVYIVREKLNHMLMIPLQDPHPSTLS